MLRHVDLINFHAESTPRESGLLLAADVDAQAGNGNVARNENARLGIDGQVHRCFEPPLRSGPAQAGLVDVQLIEREIRNVDLSLGEKAVVSLGDVGIDAKRAVAEAGLHDDASRSRRFGVVDREPFHFNGWKLQFAVGRLAGDVVADPQPRAQESGPVDQDAERFGVVLGFFFLFFGEVAEVGDHQRPVLEPGDVHAELVEFEVLDVRDLAQERHPTDVDVSALPGHERRVVRRLALFGSRTVGPERDVLEGHRPREEPEVDVPDRDFSFEVFVALRDDDLLHDRRKGDADQEQEADDADEDPSPPGSGPESPEKRRGVFNAFGHAH